VLHIFNNYARKGLNFVDGEPGGLNLTNTRKVRVAEGTYSFGDCQMLVTSNIGYIMI